MQKEVLKKEHFSLRNHISLFVPSGLSCLFGAFAGLFSLEKALRWFRKGTGYSK